LTILSFLLFITIIISRQVSQPAKACLFLMTVRYLNRRRQNFQNFNVY